MNQMAKSSKKLPISKFDKDNESEESEQESGEGDGEGEGDENKETDKIRQMYINLKRKQKTDSIVQKLKSNSKLKAQIFLQKTTMLANIRKNTVVKPQPYRSHQSIKKMYLHKTGNATFRQRAKDLNIKVFPEKINLNFDNAYSRHCCTTTRPLPSKGLLEIPSIPSIKPKKRSKLQEQIK